MKSLERFTACREPCGDRSGPVSDEWQTNSSLSDTQRTQHGQPGLEVKTARAVNSPGWQREREEGENVSDGCVRVLVGTGKKRDGVEQIEKKTNTLLFNQWQVIFSEWFSFSLILNTNTQIEM